MATIVNAKFKQKRGTEASIPILLEGELYVCTDSKKVYVGTASGNQLICDISQLNEMVNKNKIVENLNTTEDGFVLGGKQGKKLLDLILAINNRTSYIANLDYNTTLFTKFNIDTLNTPYKQGLTNGTEGYCLSFDINFQLVFIYITNEIFIRSNMETWKKLDI